MKLFIITFLFSITTAFANVECPKDYKEGRAHEIISHDAGTVIYNDIGYPKLNFTYSGYLARNSRAINCWIKVNGAEGNFSMEKNSGWFYQIAQNQYSPRNFQQMFKDTANWGKFEIQIACMNERGEWDNNFNKNHKVCVKR